MEQPSRLYVYDNIEVVLTGRVAHKTLTSGKKDTLVEIKPAADGNWLKWVKQQDLYMIELPPSLSLPCALKILEEPK